MVDMEKDSQKFSFESCPIHLASTFKDLLTEGHFSDVTLVSDDHKQVPAHKIVISSCSPVLKSLLLTNPHSHPLLYMRGIKEQDLLSILQFMYFGETTVFQDSVRQFTNIAKDLGMEERTKENTSNE